jgi:hypothetical protein
VKLIDHETQLIMEKLTLEARDLLGGTANFFAGLGETPNPRTYFEGVLNSKPTRPSAMFLLKFK